MSEWKEAKISDLCELIVDCVNRTAPTVDYITPFKMIRTTNVRNGKIDNINVRYATEEIYNTWIRRGKPQIDDIILTREAPVGEVGRITVSDSLFLGQRTMMYRANQKKTHPHFLFYSFFTKEFKEQVQSTGMGSVVEHIRVPDAKEFVIRYPKSIQEQTAIASIFSSLDDKIDLLHRQNATLEKMAETLFRQWFVEEAKEDWVSGKLSDLVVVKYGKDHKKLNEGKIPVFGSGGLMRYAEKALYQYESVLIPRKGTLNNVMYQNEPFWTVDTMFYTEMKFPNIAKYIYHFLKEQDLASMNVGSAVPSMTTEILNNMPLELPSADIFEKFENSVYPLYGKLKSNQTQIRTLTSLRDTLLPKLMSGEVKVEY